MDERIDEEKWRKAMVYCKDLSKILILKKIAK